MDKVEERDYTNKEGVLAKSYDIKFANREDKIAKQLEEINSRLLKVLMIVETLGRKLLTPTKETVPYPQGEPEEPNFDLPF